MMHALVVIGASLGGLRAVGTVLSALPAWFPLPVVIVQHRGVAGGEDEMTLCNLLQRRCALPVREPEDKEPLKHGHVYLAPADYHLLLEEGHAAFSTDAPMHYARPSIDVLFESAAEECREGVIGVLLTGANADGAQGLAAIKKRGGLTVAQDPATAEAGTMPQAAIAAGAVDYVLSLEAIGPFLVERAS